MTSTAEADLADELGPIDFVAVGFPAGKVTGDGFAQLLDLAERGVIRILDVEFVVKGRGGGVKRVAVSEVDTGGVDLGAWEGACSDLLDDDDVEQVGAALQPGAVAVIVVFENRWVLAVVDAWRRDGAHLIADGGLSAADVISALDATEPS